MTANEAEIRRNANGSIDTDHYIRQCHRQRSLAAHAALTSLWAFMGRLFKGRSGNIVEVEAAIRYDHPAAFRKAA